MRVVGTVTASVVGHVGLMRGLSGGARSTLQLRVSVGWSRQTALVSDKPRASCACGLPGSRSVKTLIRDATPDADCGRQGRPNARFRWLTHVVEALMLPCQATPGSWRWRRIASFRQQWDHLLQLSASIMDLGQGVGRYRLAERSRWRDRAAMWVLRTGVFTAHAVRNPRYSVGAPGSRTTSPSVELSDHTGDSCHASLTFALTSADPHYLIENAESGP